MHMHLGSIKAFQGNKRIYEIVEVVFLLDPLMPNSPCNRLRPLNPQSLLYLVYCYPTKYSIVEYDFST